MFIVTVNTTGLPHFLRSTIWTADINRADKFETMEAATAALAKAKKFMKATTFKAAKIIAA
jgi:hypothetical protein